MISTSPDVSAVPWFFCAALIGPIASLKLLPGVAPVAKQQGVYVADLIKQRLRGGVSAKPFRYRDYGNFATIGRKAAVVDFGWLHMRGLLAWILWSFAHVYFLIGFRNRIVVAVQWLWAYFTFQRGARLIVGRRRE